jgi:hypothetical protein
LDRGRAPWRERAQPMTDWTVKADVRVKRPLGWRPLSLDRRNLIGRGALGDDPGHGVPTNPAVVLDRRTPKF